MTRNMKQGYKTAGILAGQIIAQNENALIHPEFEASKIQDDFIASALLEILTVYVAMNRASLNGNLSVCGL